MPETIGTYQVLGPLGSSGELFRARDTRLGRTAAVRLLPPDVDEHDPRLDAVRRAQTLSHPHLAAVYDIGRDRERTFVASEFVSGDTLARVLAGQPLNPRTAATFAAQLADALAEAHAAALVHGDVGPGTIVVTPKGQAKLLDLGLSAFTRGGRSRALASRLNLDAEGPQAREVLPYLSPEQALGGTTDARSDIFSLGAVLYAMLTGHAPFEGRDAQDTVVAVLKSTAPRPGLTNAAVTPALDDVVERALGKSLDARFGSAAEFAARLRACAEALEERTLAEPVVVVKPRRGRAGIVALVLIAAALAIAALWLIR